VVEAHDPLRCPVCLDGFNSYQALERHKMKNHVELYDKTELACKVCGQEFDSRLRCFLHENECRGAVNERVRCDAVEVRNGNNVNTMTSGTSSRGRPKGAGDQKRTYSPMYARTYMQRKLSMETEEERGARQRKQRIAMKKYLDRKRAQRYPCKLCR
jgi:hypothetical protein